MTRSEVRSGLQDLLQTILVSGGYNTNAGNNVEFGYKVPEQVAKDKFPNLRINFPLENVQHESGCNYKRDITVNIYCYTHGTEQEQLFADTDSLVEDVLTVVLSDPRINNKADTNSEIEINSYVLGSYGVSIFNFNYSGVFQSN